MLTLTKTPTLAQTLILNPNPLKYIIENRPKIVPNFMRTPKKMTPVGERIHRSTTEKYAARFFNYLIWRVRVLVVVRVWVRVTVGATVMVGVGLVRG